MLEAVSVQGWRGPRTRRRGVPSIMCVLDGSGKIRAEVGWKLRGEDGVVVVVVENGSIKENNLPFKVIKGKYYVLLR